MSYTATIARVQTRPHPTADKLLLGVCLGNQVVVGKDTQDGTLGLFFPTDGQLSHEMCVHNGLYTKSAMQKLGLPIEEGQTFGFFDHHRRVRSQKFRGEKSDGFWVPLSYVQWALPPNIAAREEAFAVGMEFVEGQQFVSVHGHLICEKYVTPATKRAQSQRQGKGRVSRGSTLWFKKHVETSQFRDVAHEIPIGSVVYVTEKLHGTSARFGHVLDIVEPSRIRQFFGRVLPFLNREERQYRYLNGTRNLILERGVDGSFYGNEDFRYNVVASVQLAKGEVVYGEIVGDVAIGKPIMPGQAIKDADFAAVYGKRMAYTYGTEPGEHRLYVYRITQVNEDGHTVELSWPQVKGRCGTLGLTPVPELSRHFIEDPEDIAQLRVNVEETVDGPSLLDARHIREGVVVRVESERGTAFVKHKSFIFGVLEGYIKDDDLYVDTEEAA
jgi:hypothetical protein